MKMWFITMLALMAITFPAFAVEEKDYKIEEPEKARPKISIPFLITAVVEHPDGKPVTAEELAKATFQNIESQVSTCICENPESLKKQIEAFLSKGVPIEPLTQPTTTDSISLGKASGVKFETVLPFIVSYDTTSANGKLIARENQAEAILDSLKGELAPLLREDQAKLENEFREEIKRISAAAARR